MRVPVMSLVLPAPWLGWPGVWAEESSGHVDGSDWPVQAWLHADGSHPRVVLQLGGIGSHARVASRHAGHDLDGAGLLAGEVCEQGLGDLPALSTGAW